MKIMDFFEFAALPKGTLFSYYDEDLIRTSGLYAKGETLSYGHEGDTPGPRDFFLIPLVPGCYNGETPVLDGIMERWGLFDFDQKFAVLEDADVAVLQGLVALHPVNCRPAV